MEFFKKNKKFVAWALLVTLVLIPLFIQVLINWDTMNNGSDDGWLGFWGGYLGSIIGVVGALIVIQIQLSNEKERFDKETKAKNKELAEDKKRFELQIEARDKELEEERKARKSEQVDNTFFNLLLLFNDQKNTLLKDKNHFEELRGSIFDNSVLELRRMGIDKLYESSDELISILENMIKEFDIKFNSRRTQYSQNIQDCLSAIRKDYINYLSYLQEFHLSQENYNSIKTEIDDIQVVYIIEDNLIQNIKNKKFSERTPTLYDNLDKLIKELQDVSQVDFLDSKSKKNLRKYIGKLLPYTDPSNLNLLELSYKKAAIENSINGYYSSIDSFFSMILRILNYIHENVDDEENEGLKKDYISFLRANISEIQLVILYYFAFFTDRGTTLKNELLETSFFGEQNELSSFDRAYFFKKESLIWGEEDLKNMQEFC
ncbi:putative phage abortive infection protein [Enterococcus casseliflavus]|uniref:putative phage abortive infection protein n=2 Tax=Enterococcus casseliflavus TaxID=37734 RepID=UPI0022E296F9|nr:putative phage abortive infection protein [Enterococcus casseliflavus]